MIILVGLFVDSYPIDKLEAAKERANPLFGKADILKIKVSPSGKEPHTHLFCEMNVTEETAEKLLKIKLHTEMEVSSKEVFLKKRGLTIIKEGL